MVIGINATTASLKAWRSRVLLAVVVLLVGFVSSSYLLNEVLRSLTESGNNRYQSYLLADELRQSSDDLTRMVRTFAATGEKKFEDQFREVLAIRNGKQPRPANYNHIYWDFLAAFDHLSGEPGEKQSLRQMMVVQGITMEELALLRQAQDQSDALVSLEDIAMRAINDRLTEVDEQYRLQDESNRNMALRLLHGSEYHLAKARIMEPIQKFFIKLNERTAAQFAQYASRSNFLIVVSVVLVILVCILAFVAAFLSRTISEKERAALSNKNKELDFQKHSLDEHAIVSITDVKGNITYANDKFCNVSEYSREELLGENHSILKSGEHSREFYQELWRTISNGRVWRGEIKNRKKGGAYYWLNATIIPFLDDTGKPFQYVAIRTDISKTKQIEEELRESEERFRSMSNSSSVAMIVAIDQDGKIIFWNRAAELGFGYSEAEILGHPVTDIMPEQFREAHLHGLQRALGTGDHRVIGTTVELVALKKNGEEFEIELSLGTWNRSEEKFFSAVIHDISDRKRAEKELFENQRKAEAANLAKSNFLSTMSHEIRTPLNGVLGLAQLLANTDLDQDQRKKVDTILSSGQTLLAIINDVLDMSRIEAGGIELENKAFSLRNLVSIIATPFQSMADDKGLKLIVNDSIGSGIVVKGDPVRLRQVLWNLLGNAIKFTDNGSVTLTIENVDGAEHQGLQTNGHLIQFAVEDTGAGIASDRVKLIFDAFTQEDSSISRKYGGTGLGLSIVKQLTELMGGTIDVKSELGKGTKFKTRIPFEEATKEEADALSLDNMLTSIQKIESLNVLIVEDNDVNAVIARAFLEKSGHKVVHVVNGTQAVDAAKEDWADMILMDIHMPEMNGIDATKLIRATDIGARLPIVGLTAEAFTERHAEFVKAGMDGVLTKPFTEQQLSDTLATYRWSRGNKDRNGSSLSYDVNDHLGLSGMEDGIEDETTDSEASSPVVSSIGDADKLDGFRQALSSDVVSNLLEKAQESLHERMAKLRHGLDTSNCDMIHEAAHSIKGASGSMFATRISELAAVIEERSNDIDAIQELLPELEDVAVDTIEWWRSQAT